jgi:hypothetical protein
MAPEKSGVSSLHGANKKVQSLAPKKLGVRRPAHVQKECPHPHSKTTCELKLYIANMFVYLIFEVCLYNYYLCSNLWTVYLCTYNCTLLI